MSLIIALLISLVFWFLTFNFFFSYSHWPISLVIAVAAGIIAFLLLRAWTKHRQLAAPPLIGQFVFPVAVVSLLFFASREFLPYPEHCKLHETVKVSCGPASVEKDKKKICVRKGGSITWNLPPGKTVKIHELKEQSFPDFWNWDDADPIPFDEAEYENVTKIVANVLDHGGYFKYSVSCLGGPVDKEDPMTEVPPRK
jgi:hypothetical protein